MEINNFCVLANGGDSFEYVSDAHSRKKRKFQRFTTVVVSSVRDHVGTRIWSLEWRLLWGGHGQSKHQTPSALHANQSKSKFIANASQLHWVRDIVWPMDGWKATVAAWPRMDCHVQCHSPFHVEQARTENITFQHLNLDCSNMFRARETTKVC